LSAGKGFAAAFHLYAVEWEPDVVRFYVDETLYATFSASSVASTPATAGSWVFDHPFFLVLNVAVGGNWPGPPDSTTTFPQTMLIDYVRVYTAKH
jgi:beta-glucanase (GH16 family)